MKRIFAKDSITLIDFLFPLRGINSYIKNFLFIIFGTLLLAVSSKIQVPFWPVPMTMQTFMVFSYSYGIRLETIFFNFNCLFN